MSAIYIRITVHISLYLSPFYTYICIYVYTGIFASASRALDSLPSLGALYKTIDYKLYSTSIDSNPFLRLPKVQPFSNIWMGVEMGVKR